MMGRVLASSGLQFYATNDFTGTQANAVRKFIKEANAGVDIVYDQGCPPRPRTIPSCSTSIRAANPDAVIQLGYAPNDTPFLRNMQDSGTRFNFCSASTPGLRRRLLEDVGRKAASITSTPMCPRRKSPTRPISACR